MTLIRWKLALFLMFFWAIDGHRLALAQTQPLVAIHDSELTRGFETQAAANGTPTGAGTTGKQWWPTDWHYFVMPESLEEMFRSDGTAFTTVSDANITAGALLSNGVPKYPIMISLAAEAMRDDEITPLTNYVAAGGILFVGSSSFTRNTNGSSRGDFAIANAMGVHMVSGNLLNWGLANYLTPTNTHAITQDIPTGDNYWRMPASSEEISWGTDPAHNYQLPHDVWQINAGTATVLAWGDNYPYITVQQFGKGYIIYDAAFQPVIGHGGFAPGMYAYMIFRRSVEWAFNLDGLPVPKLSAWPYQYDSAYMVRHDLENYTNEIENILSSAMMEWTNNSHGDYYFCTGQLRQDMYNLINTNTVINNLRTAVSSYNAFIGPHNGGLRNQNNLSGLHETLGSASDYDYWHWGQDELLDLTGPITNNGIVYANSTNYCISSISNAFKDTETWLSGLESSSMRSYISPYFNSTRETSEAMLQQLNVKISGDEKVGPFPHWTLSTQTSGLRYGVLSEPVSDWFVGGLVAQSLEPWHPPGVHTSDTMHTAVDFFYGIGALCNIYSHTLSYSTGYVGDAGPLTADYVTYCANTNIHPRFWAADATNIYNWWLARSNAQVSVNFTTNGTQSVTTFTISGSQRTNTSIELLIPASTSYCNLQVFTNGSPCSTNYYRVNNQLVKVCVGTTVTNVVISYYPMSSPATIFAQNFDGVTAPALPAGWTTSSSGVEVNWVTQKTNVDTALNALFVPDVNNIGLSDVVSPSITLPVGQSQLSFMNSYNLETGSGGDGFDGGVLEISITNGPFTDILAAGGSFVSGGYNSTIDSAYMNPLVGRQAWSGNSGGFVQTIVNLPASAAGTNIQLRWRCGTDNGNKAIGWWIDTISITNRACACCGNNGPPSLPSINPQTISEFATLTVTNTATDPNGNALFYFLTNTTPANASISLNGVITWSPLQTQSPGTNTFTTVTYDNGTPSMAATNSFTVFVLESNIAPTLASISPKTNGEFSTFSITNAATETNIHSVTTGYGLLAAPAGAQINGSGVITWSPLQTQSPSTNTFTMVVSNSNPYDLVKPVLTNTTTFTVVIKEQNIAPMLTNISQQTVGEFSTLTITNAATETNIHAVTTGYKLTGPSGASINSSGVITWSPTQGQSPSTNTFTTVVTNFDSFDTVNPKLTATNTFTVIVSEVNIAPTLTNISQQTIGEFSTLTVTNAATETNVHTITTGYSLTGPSGASINSSGVITWSPQQSQSPSTNTFTTVVTNFDSFDTINPRLTSTNSFTVIVKEVNSAPTLANVGTQTIGEFSTFTFTNAATETNIHATIAGYNLSVAPTGASINASGVITWSPQQTQSPSTNTFTTIVTNSDPLDTINPVLTATNTFKVIVNEVNVAPTLGTVAPQTIGEFSTLSVTNAATETNIHSITSGYGLLVAPPGAQISAGGVITWSPLQTQSPSTNTFTMVVSNSNPYDAINPVLTNTSTFTVIVKEVNSAPTLANVGTQTIGEFSTFTLTNAAAETNIHATITGYSLSVAPTGASINASGIITWSPQQSQSPSTNTFTTIVTNSDPLDTINPVLTATNTFNVIVNEVNVAPTLGTIAPQTISEFGVLTVTNSATETNIHSSTTGYGLLVAPAGALINASGIISWTPGQSNSPGTNLFTTVVTNSNPYDTVNPALASTNSFTVTVTESNLAPVLATLPDTNVNELATLIVTNGAAEPNVHASTLGYGLLNAPAGMTIDTNGVITWTPAQAQSPGTNVITTVVTNSDAADAIHPMLTATNSFKVVVNEVNMAPTLGTIAPQIINEFSTLTVTNAATETNIHSVTIGYGLLAAPAGAIIDSNGVITWQPGQGYSPSTNTFTTVVTNTNPFDTNNPMLAATNSFTVMVTESNLAPILPTLADTNVNELALLIVTNTATEPNIHAVTVGYGLLTGPAGMAINTNGIITWTPDQTQSPGTNIVTTVVTNSNPFDLVTPVLTATNSFRVVVKEVNIPPTLGTIAPQTISEFGSLLVTNAASESNIHSVTAGYGLLVAPAGAQISASGVISWTPGQSNSPGTNLFTTVVTNSNPFDAVNPSLTATNSFTVVVTEANLAPVLPSLADTNVNELATLVITNTAGEPNAHATTIGYGLLAGPAGMAIDTNGVITWTPAQTQSPGTNFITIVVTNNDAFDLVNPMLTATNGFKLVVNEVNMAPVLSAIPPQTVGALQTLTVTNTAVETNIHSVTTGYSLLNAPAGAGVDSNGVIAWTPGINQSPSTNVITMVVSNSNPYDSLNPVLTATNSFTVVVNDVNQAPVLPALMDVSVDEHVTLTVTNAASEPNAHSTTVGYGLVNPPQGAGIDSNGIITWTPSGFQGPGTNVITTIVTNLNPYDSVYPSLTATNSFTVFVTEPVDSPLITSITVSNQVATVTFTTVPGHTYQLQYHDTTTTNWTPVVPGVTAIGAQASVTNALGSAANRLYKVETSDEQFHRRH